MIEEYSIVDSKVKKINTLEKDLKDNQQLGYNSIERNTKDQRFLRNLVYLRKRLKTFKSLTQERLR